MSFISVDRSVKVHVSSPSDDTSQAPLIDLSSFKGLEEVGLSLIRIRRPNQWIGAILQTVVSKRLRKITFDLDFPCDPPEIDSEIDLDRWSGLDAMFLTMAGMLDGTGEKLEIVFNALASNVDGELKPVEPGRFLERCRAKAAVRFEYWCVPPLLRYVEPLELIWISAARN